MNAHHPTFSRLELARGGGRGTAADGRLEVHELLGMWAASWLVFRVLSVGLGPDHGLREAHFTNARA